MDKDFKSNCFSVVFDTTFGAISGFGAVLLYETAIASFLSKSLNVPSLQKILKSSASTVPIAAGISLINSVNEIKNKNSIR